MKALPFAAVLLLQLLLGACGEQAPPPPVVAGAGASLERAAVARGIVADPATIDPVGVFASDSDHVCVVPAGGGYTVGASVDYGEGQSCAASGTATATATGRGTLTVRFSDACRFEAWIEGDRITFPAILPGTCDRTCTGRASFSTLTADRLSASATEAATVVSPRGARLCP